MKISWEAVRYDYDKLKEKWMNSEDEDTMGDISIEDCSMGKMVSTPFGLYEVVEAFNPLNHHEFWIGHTNFDITQSFLDIADNIPGIEGVKVFSRYRFLITVGKLFSFSQVRTMLELALGTLSLSPEILCKKEELDSSGKKWNMYIFPDLKKFYLAVEGDSYEDDLANIEELASTGSGFLLSSEEDYDI